MILIITEATEAAAEQIKKLALSFGCKLHHSEQDILLEKNAQLSEQEFSILAGKIVMTGSTVKLD